MHQPRERYLTVSFSDGDVTCAFISSKRKPSEIDLLKQS